MHRVPVRGCGAPRTGDYTRPHGLYAATFPDGQQTTVACDVNPSSADGPTIGISNGVVTRLAGGGDQRALRAKDLRKVLLGGLSADLLSHRGWK